MVSTVFSDLSIPIRRILQYKKRMIFQQVSKIFGKRNILTWFFEVISLLAVCLEICSKCLRLCEKFTLFWSCSPDCIRKFL